MNNLEDCQPADIMNTDIFRLAAVLYADSNYEVNSATIHKKIVESIFVENENNIISIYELAEEIKSRYNIILDHTEIEKVLNKSESFIKTKGKNSDLEISLNHSRYVLIKEKVKENNLDYFIEQFQKEFTQITLAVLKEVIYSFLYEVFKTNLTSFSKLIDSSTSVEEIVQGSDQDFNPLQIDIINSFINWDNASKNKAIFDISNVALEYCLISNKKGNSFKLDSLKNKNFYLDTNILFRAIGLNGENRMTKTLTFLEKFKEANENLFITRFTFEEFKKTIKSHLTTISNRGRRVNSNVFLNFGRTDDIASYYHRWRIRRHNDSIDLFEAHIMSELQSLLNKFDIHRDFKSAVDMDDAEIKKTIFDKSSQINTYKSFDRPNYGTNEGHVVDAKNIYIIEQKRNVNVSNIFDCKFFMISSDRLLQKWDYTKNTVIPIVILPSQWMSILLRYLNRTDDDFKSFVGFLNLNSPDKVVSNENLYLILQGISEITEDFSTQSGIVSEMVNTKFKGIIENNFSEEEIVNKSKEFAKSKLERDLENVQEENKRLDNRFQNYHAETSKALKSLKDQKSREYDEKKIVQIKNERFKGMLIENKVNSGYLKYKLAGILALAILMISTLAMLLTFFFTDSTWNIMNDFRAYADGLPQDTIQKNAINYVHILIFTAIASSALAVYNLLLNPSKIKARKDNLYEKYKNQIEEE